MQFETLLNRAEQIAGLTDWGGTEFWEEGFRHYFRILCQSLKEEAGLSTFGQAAARERLLNTMIGRLAMVEDRKRYPEIRNEQIVSPIVTFGLPRSGTTFLHNLLSQDPRHLSPLTWQIMYPSPPPACLGAAEDPRINACEAALERQGWLNPDLTNIHPFGARLAEECGFIWEYSGVGHFQFYWNVPTYAAAVASADYEQVFQVHRHFLQAMQYRDPRRRWVLKGPRYIWHIQQLFRTYPDAVAIQNHRDPAKIIPSAASFSSAWKGVYVDNADSLDVTFQPYIAALGKSLYQLMAVRADAGLDDRIFDCSFLEMIADPIGMVASIYGRFGLGFPGEAEQRMRQFLEQDSHAKGSRHVYSGRAGAMAEEDIEREFAAYLDHYGIARERRSEGSAA